MTRAAERSGSRDIDATMALLDGVVYGDLFDCAVGLDEIVRYSRRASGRDDAATVLGSPTLRRTVVRQGDYVTLAGREELVEQRKETRARARRLQRRAQRMGRLLGLVPFVRGLILTGSVAAEAAAEDADIDLLVIVAPSRLAFVFLLLGGFSRLTRRRLYCANYYMADDRLQVDRRNLFIAREIVQARPLDEGGERWKLSLASKMTSCAGMQRSASATSVPSTSGCPWRRCRMQRMVSASASESSTK